MFQSNNYSTSPNWLLRIHTQLCKACRYELVVVVVLTTTTGYCGHFFGSKNCDARRKYQTHIPLWYWYCCRQKLTEQYGLIHHFGYEHATHVPAYTRKCHTRIHLLLMMASVRKLSHIYTYLSNTIFNLFYIRFIFVTRGYDGSKKKLLWNSYQLETNYNDSNFLLWIFDLI